MMSQTFTKKGLWIKISKADGEERHKLISLGKGLPQQAVNDSAKGERNGGAADSTSEINTKSWPTKPPLFGGKFKVEKTELAVYLSLSNIFSGVRGSGVKVDIKTTEDESKLEDWIATEEGNAWLKETKTITYFLAYFEVNDVFPK